MTSISNSISGSISISISIAVVVVCLCLCGSIASQTPTLGRITITHAHGIAYSDPLAYLRSDTATRNAYLNAESAAAAHFFRKTNRRLLNRTSNALSALLQVDHVAPPVPDLAHGWAYWTTSSPRGPIHWRKPWIVSSASTAHASPPAPPAHLTADSHELLLDPTTLPAGHALKKLALSPSHGLLGYLVEPHGQEFGTLHIKRLSTRTFSPTDLDAIPNGAVACLAGLPIMGFEFLSDTRIAYTLCDASLRPSIVMVGDWREPARKHVKLVDESEGVGFIDLGKTKDDKFLTINSSTLTSSKVYVYPTSAEHAGPDELVLISDRQEGHQYFVDHQGSQFYILTNSDGATDFKIVTAPTSCPSRSSWQDLLVPDAGDKLEDVDLFDKHLVLYMRRKGESVVLVHPISRERESPPEPERKPEPAQAYQVPVPRGSTVVPGVNLDSHSPTVRMILQQPYEYDATIDWHLHERKLNVRRRQLLPRKEFDPAQYDLTRTWVSSRDSLARIPVTLLHRRGLPATRANPTLLRAYGAYGLALDPTLRLDTLELVRSGWIVALAHVRGGGELGRAWHQAARLTCKRTSAQDLVDVAEYLCGPSHLTSPARLAVAGHSAGALAVAGAALLRPDMFTAMVLNAPFVDVLGSMLDASLPLTRGEFDEWGDPCKDKQVWDAMLGYSPYELVLQRLTEKHQENKPRCRIYTARADLSSALTLRFWSLRITDGDNGPSVCRIHYLLFHRQSLMSVLVLIWDHACWLLGR
ncbi:prolyl oligopeptidase [Catenaria anguillulae PL171]|uniref:Prolyl endopeptidase n=1 Tax=Catenaria anguillulae PL171 TaxID=765915 RepID=A0A1Y2H718_9FUNG|nr:prolyl oligopeptidase [Catenaria anguillulae PL171]